MRTLDSFNIKEQEEKMILPLEVVLLYLGLGVPVLIGVFLWRKDMWSMAKGVMGNLREVDPLLGFRIVRGGAIACIVVVMWFIWVIILLLAVRRQLIGRVNVPEGEQEPPVAVKKRKPEVDKTLSKDQNKELGKICTLYEQNIGMLTPMIGERLKEIASDVPEGWFAMAVQEAVDYNKRNLRYIERILENWQVNGVKRGEAVSKEQVQQLEKQIAISGAGSVRGKLKGTLKKKAYVFIRDKKRAGQKEVTTGEVLFNLDNSPEFLALCERIGYPRADMVKMCIELGAVDKK